MVILGIDPGTTRMGYGVIKKDGSRLTHLKSGIFNISRTDPAGRLAEIEKELKKLFDETGPSVVGLEKIFFAKNRKTAIEVAQARGVVLSVLGKESTTIKELSPSEIKLAVTGYGRASKSAVAKMVHYFLGISTEKLLDDEVDALAIAITASGKEYS